jgi:hypothetical protein
MVKILEDLQKKPAAKFFRVTVVISSDMSDENQKLYFNMFKDITLPSCLQF